MDRQDSFMDRKIDNAWISRWAVRWRDILIDRWMDRYINIMIDRKIKLNNHRLKDNKS